MRRLLFGIQDKGTCLQDSGSNSPSLSKIFLRSRREDFAIPEHSRRLCEDLRNRSNEELREILDSVVPDEGLEPPCLAALDPKSSVSANSTSRANGILFSFTSA